MTSLPSPILDKILPVLETSDMTLVTRLGQIISKNMRDIAREIHDNFPLWYDPLLTPITGQVFWSENHYIMNCSSDLLLREMLGVPVPNELLERLHTFLDVKIYFGTAEWLSPVYLPFTITSLLNIYDLTRYEDLRDKCQTLLDRIATEVLSVASPYAGAIISPSGRAYSRHRKSTTGTHLNLFIDFLIMGTNLPRLPRDPEMALRECLATTKYRPNPIVYTYFRNQKVDAYVRLSSRWEDLVNYLEMKKVPLDVYVSLIWGYGMYVPQQYNVIKKVLAFMDTYNLWNHPHFKALAKTRKAFRCCKSTGLARFLQGLSNTWGISQIVKGAMLTNASMYVHKDGKVIMSSLVGYNAGLPSFQQWPFAINLFGTPIWCGFGSVGAGGISCLGNPEAGKELSTARVIPRIRQTGNYLRAIYKPASYLIACSTIGLRPQMYWPVEQFDDHGKYGQWNWARKANAVVAYKIVRVEVEIYVKDLQLANMTLEDFLMTLL